MYCHQCEQTAKGIACTIQGVCGKDPTTATLQDLLIHAAKGISAYAHRARALGAIDREVDVSVTRVLQAVPGVDAVDVSLEKGEAELRFDPARAGASEFRNAVQDAGFEAA